MKTTFLNYDLMRHFAADQFKSATPFPWHDFHQFITPEGFDRLYDEFPSLSFFEKHEGLKRIYGQRPHNRYYLAYESTIYNQVDRNAGEGIIMHQDLPESWQIFIDELETSKEYRNFIRSMFGVQKFQVRYAWHVGVTNSEVSPHRDAPEKIGTHIFYFNTSEDWNSDWGGSLLVLDRKLTEEMNPNFADFVVTIPSQLVDNHSFLFRNTPDAWHGVKPLTCPEGKFRRLFNVIFDEPPKPKRSFGRRLLRKGLSLIQPKPR